MIKNILQRYSVRRSEIIYVVLKYFIFRRRLRLQSVKNLEVYVKKFYIKQMKSIL